MNKVELSNLDKNKNHFKIKFLFVWWYLILLTAFILIYISAYDILNNKELDRILMLSQTTLGIYYIIAVLFRLTTNRKKMYRKTFIFVMLVLIVSIIIILTSLFFMFFLFMVGSEQTYKIAPFFIWALFHGAASLILIIIIPLLKLILR